MTVTQATFRAAILDAGQPVPEGLLDAAAGPAGARFSVYRNNVIVSLTEALQVGFPLLRKLIGAKAFTQLGATFVRQHPPTSPLMMQYGDVMPAFLEDFRPLMHIGYLPDCARLDLAMRSSYHASDAQPLDPSCFGNSDALMEMTFALAPSTRILRSPWPLYDLWRYNMVPGAPKPQAVPQEVLITRPDFDPAPHLLPAGAADWLTMIEEGEAFGEAITQMTSSTPDFDLAQVLTLVLETQALTSPSTKEN